MCLRKVDYLNRFAFGDTEFLSENLREPIDEERLSCCLFMDRFNDFRGELLSDLVGVLGKEFTNLF